ncbi:MAG: NUDIX hydrolase [Prevotella sp.]|nr:NUDIX hydrolase [Prevotella sp.]MBO5157344.1 NUDIX hydrolase [Prevotella sp.]
MNEINKTEEKREYCYKFPHPSVTTDCVIFGFDGTKLRILLVQRGIEPYKGRWAFPGGFLKMDEVPQLAFDHDQILRKAELALRQQIHFEPVGFELLPEEFTIKELQNLYEAILDVRFDRRNFYNKMKRLEMLEQMDETVNPSQKKEAFLFRFNKAKYEELKQKGFRLEF